MQSLIELQSEIVTAALTDAANRLERAARADNDIDLHTARLHIWHTAWLLDQGDKGGYESSRAKVVCSESLWRVVDRCVQILGGLGVTQDTVVERIFRESRAALVMGPTTDVLYDFIGKAVCGLPLF